MVCKFCGNTIEDNSEFCFICGNKAIKDEIPAEAVFTQPKPAEVPVVTAEAPAQAVYAQPAPVYAQPAPAYDQAPAAPQTEEAQPVEEDKKSKKKAKKEAKKAKKGDKSVCTKARKFFAALFAATFILQFIPWLWCKKAKKAGYEEKAADISNAIMVGLCIFMGIICIVLAKKFML